MLKADYGESASEQKPCAYAIKFLLLFVFGVIKKWKKVAKKKWKRFEREEARKNIRKNKMLTEVVSNHHCCPWNTCFSHSSCCHIRSKFIWIHFRLRCVMNIMYIVVTMDNERTNVIIAQSTLTFICANESEYFFSLSFSLVSFLSLFLFLLLHLLLLLILFQSPTVGYKYVGNARRRIKCSKRTNTRKCAHTRWR